jgi:NAD(P)-dependent dehydrogenase (short-subunit alcohol dehydrogenase family)
VEGFFADGAKVAAFYNQSPPPVAIAEKACWIKCDVANKGEVDTAFDQVVGVLGGLDALIQAAGTWRGAAPETVTEEQIDFLLSLNVKSTIFTNQAAYRVMQAAGGRIVNFGSSEGVSGNPNSPVYAATRGAVHSWTRSAAKAWGKKGINVNAIAPAMQTSLVDYNLSQLSEAARAAFLEALKGRIPIDGKLGEPLRDLYPVLRLLAGPGGRFITGQLIAVDGGLIMLGA